MASGHRCTCRDDPVPDWPYAEGFRRRAAPSTGQEKDVKVKAEVKPEPMDVS